MCAVLAVHRALLDGNMEPRGIQIPAENLNGLVAEGGPYKELYCLSARWCELTLTPTLDMVVSGKILSRIFVLFFSTLSLAASCRDKVQYGWYELTLIDPTLDQG